MSNILLYKSASPSTPPAGTVLLYPKADGKFYYMGEDGVEYKILDIAGSSPSAVIRVVSGTTDAISESDNGKVLIYTNAAGCAVDWPDGLSTAFQCSIITTSAVAPIITPIGSETINGISAAVSPQAQWKAIYIVKYSATESIAVF